MTLPGEAESRVLSRDAGFTLMEMIIVMAIMGLMLGLLVHRIGLTNTGLSLRGATNELAAGLREARSAAIATNRPVSIAIDPAQGAWLTPGGERKTLPQTASLKLVTVSSQARKADKGDIRFDPDGSSSGGRIELTEGKRRMQIGIDWLTGRVSVASGP